MDLLARIVVGCAVIAGGYQLFQLLAAWLYFRRAARRAARHTGPLPPVTVLKPLKGPGVDLYENLKSFCQQEYPAYQIVFGVEDADDPAVSVVQRIRREFPSLDITLSIDCAPGANRKVANLRHMMRHARHSLLVMSDSDIRVRPDYLRTMVAPLADPGEDRRLALTTCLYRGVALLGPPSVLESLFINTDFIPMVLTAQLVQRFRYAYGASIAVTREALDRIGGFEALVDYLADDYLLGNRIAKAGYRLRLLPYVVETVLDSRTYGDVWRHQLRWARTYRVCQPVGWFLTVVTHATLWGVLSALVIGGLLGWSMLAGTLAARLGALAGILHLLGDRDSRSRLWLVPFKDLVTSTVWLAALLGRQVIWSDQVLVVHTDGRMVPLPYAGIAIGHAPETAGAPSRFPTPPPPP